MNTEDPPDLHAISVRRSVHGHHALCRCGEWEGWWNGPKAQAAVLDDHDHHRRAAANGANTPPAQ